MLSKSSVDPFHELSIRTSKGSIFHVKIEICDLKASIETLKREQYTIIASSHLKQKVQLKPQHPVALILGNEGHGISDDLITLTDITLHIPTSGVDSLNVSVAGSILMYTLSE
jgi:TrmH family RNA methyltransferase